MSLALAKIDHEPEAIFVADSDAAKSAQPISIDKVGTAELLFRSAESMGLDPCWVTPQGLFAIQIDGRERYINLARSPLNSHTSTSLAKDKYLARRILERHGIENIPFTMPDNVGDAMRFLTAHGAIIAKPRYGSGARDIHMITDSQEFAGLAIENYILEKYIVGKELRYLVLNGEVIAVHQSDYGISVCENRPLRRISYREDKWSLTLVERSLVIAQMFNLRFAAVDYLIDSTGCAHVLEVNSMPGLKWFHAPSEGPVVDVANRFMYAILNHIRSGQYAQAGANNKGVAT